VYKDENAETKELVPAEYNLFKPIGDITEETKQIYLPTDWERNII
jgi:hypothetical protein